MVHGYHLILPMYGFWLPNDPRGSWSEFVRRWELVRFGKSTLSVERRQMCELSASEIATHAAARNSLTFPAVSLTGIQAAGIGRGFAKKIGLSNFTVWACSILPDHTHLVIARHVYKVEQIANLLKGAATRQLCHENRHPLAEFIRPDGRIPPIWASHQWKVFLDSETAIDEAIYYVESNPEKEGKPKQKWEFVTPFAGLEKGGWVTYH